MEMPKDIEGWTKLAKDDPLAYASIWMDLVVLSFSMPTELRGPLCAAVVAVVQSKMKTASKEAALAYKSILSGISTAREKGCAEAARKIIDELDRTLGL